MKFNENIDYYQVLGVDKDSTEEELKKAYRKKALETHPDISKDKSGEKFKRVNEAYEVLSNPDIRKRYDALRSSGHSYSRTDGSEERNNSQGPFEGFDKFYWDIFGEEWEARAPTPEEERRSYEQREKREKEFAEKEAGRKIYRERELNRLWREGMNKVLPYILRFPDLKENFLEEKWFKENFARMYERDGSLFNEDVGLFNYLINDPRGANSKDLYKILMETRGGDFAYCEARIPLITSNISGLELFIQKKVPTKLRGGQLSFCGDTTIKFAVPSGVNFQAPTNLPYEGDKSEESLMSTCQFLAHLSNCIRNEEYAIKFSQRLPEKHEIKKRLGIYANYPPGLWIESLKLKGEKVIENGEFINLANNLERISKTDGFKLPKKNI